MSSKLFEYFMTVLCKTVLNVYKLSISRTSDNKCTDIVILRSFKLSSQHSIKLTFIQSAISDTKSCLQAHGSVDNSSDSEGDCSYWKLLKIAGGWGITGVHMKSSESLPPSCKTHIITIEVHTEPELWSYICISDVHAMDGCNPFRGKRTTISWSTFKEIKMKVWKYLKLHYYEHRNTAIW